MRSILTSLLKNDISSSLHKNQLRSWWNGHTNHIAHILFVILCRDNNICIAPPILFVCLTRGHSKINRWWRTVNIYAKASNFLIANGRSWSDTIRTCTSHLLRAGIDFAPISYTNGDIIFFEVILFLVQIIMTKYILLRTFGGASKISFLQVGISGCIKRSELNF